jgi:hypothetical protein
MAAEAEAAREARAKVNKNNMIEAPSNSAKKARPSN